MCLLKTVVIAALKQGCVTVYLGFEYRTEVEELFSYDNFLQNDDDNYRLA